MEKYELTDVSYKINKKKTIEKVETITTRSKEEYPKTLTETISGKEVTLKATGDVERSEIRGRDQDAGIRGSVIFLKR